MATMNSVNTTLSGQTGTGSFVGNTSPTFSGTITTPSLSLTGQDILASPSGNILLQLSDIGATNFLDISNASTGLPLSIEAVGLDAAISIQYKAQGTGTHNLFTTSNTGIVFESGTAHQHITNFSFANTANTRTVTFPDSDGTVQFVSGAVGFTYSSVSGTFQFAVAGNAYILNNVAATEVALPLTAGSAIGDTVKIKGRSSAPWYIQAQAGQTITMGSASSSVAGTLTASAGTDSIQLVYVAANEWSVDWAMTDGVMVLA